MKTTYHQHLPIHQWSDDEQPREKLFHQGRHALSNTELLAILIGSGTKGKSAIDLARELMEKVENNLYDLGKMRIDQINQVNGFGLAKSAQVVAALEIGRRRSLEKPPKKTAITSSLNAFDLLKPVLLDLNHEEFWILMLNRANKVIDRTCISKGGISGTTADAKIIFEFALRAHASSIILSHNHPSGNCKPSRADIELTKKLVEGGKLIDVVVLDHLILTNDSYYSFADEGIL